MNLFQKLNRLFKKIMFSLIKLDIYFRIENLYENVYLRIKNNFDQGIKGNMLAYYEKFNIKLL